MKSYKSKSITKPEVLLGRIHAEFPDLTWESYIAISDGWDHEVIILDNKIVFRFPNDLKYAALLAVEIQILRQLRLLVHANIPNYIYVAIGSSFGGYPIVPGESLTKQNFDKLDKDTVNKIAEQIAVILSSLHTASSRGLDLTSAVRSYMPDEQVEASKLAAKHLSAVLSPDDYRTVEAILSDTNKVLAQSNPSTFIHGDVYCNHLLWDESTQKLGLIDFSDMCIADPAIDFAELYEYGKPFVNMVFEYYTAPKDDFFLDRALVYQRWVGVYMMTDYFVYNKTSFEVARETFDRVKLNIL